MADKIWLLCVTVQQVHSFRSNQASGLGRLCELCKKCQQSLHQDVHVCSTC